MENWDEQKLFLLKEILKFFLEQTEGTFTWEKERLFAETFLTFNDEN